MTYFDRLFFTVGQGCVLMFGLPIIFLIFFLFTKLCGRHDSDKIERFGLLLVKIEILILFLIFPSISSRIFRTFKCQQFEDSSWMVEDMSLECYTPRWWQW